MGVGGGGERRALTFCTLLEFVFLQFRLAWNYEQICHIECGGRADLPSYRASSLKTPSSSIARLNTFWPQPPRPTSAVLLWTPLLFQAGRILRVWLAAGHIPRQYDWLLHLDKLRPIASWREKKNPIWALQRYCESNRNHPYPNGNPNQLDYFDSLQTCPYLERASRGTLPTTLVGIVITPVTPSKRRKLGN